MRRVPAARSWSLAGAVALLAFQLGEPVNVAITPILFLLLGICAAARPPRAVSDAPGRIRLRPLAIACVAVLGGGAILAAVALGASTLEQWGRSYGELWADRAATRIAPW